LLRRNVCSQSEAFKLEKREKGKKKKDYITLPLKHLALEMGSLVKCFAKVPLTSVLIYGLFLFGKSIFSAQFC
jgi:hypothetical protein